MVIFVFGFLYFTIGLQSQGALQLTLIQNVVYQDCLFFFS